MLKLLMTLFFVACAQIKTPPSAPVPPKNFPSADVIQATQLLTRIFDGEIKGIRCVPSAEEASLLLRTLRPRMEVVEDDLQAHLDHPSTIQQLLVSCQQQCTCQYVDELIRENNIVLSKKERGQLNTRISDKENKRCSTAFMQTFCQGELFQTLDNEKAEFTYDDSSP